MNPNVAEVVPEGLAHFAERARGQGAALALGAAQPVRQRGRGRRTGHSAGLFLDGLFLLPLGFAVGHLVAFGLAFALPGLLVGFQRGALHHVLGHFVGFLLVRVAGLVHRQLGLDGGMSRGEKRLAGLTTKRAKKSRLRRRAALGLPAATEEAEGSCHTNLIWSQFSYLFFKVMRLGWPRSVK